MYTGALYFPNDNEILSEQQQCLEKLYDFNATPPHELRKREREALLQKTYRRALLQSAIHAAF